MRNGTILAALVATVLAVAPRASLAAWSLAAANGKITVRLTETLTGQNVTNGGVGGTGRFTISGAIIDKGTVTGYRTVKANNTALIRTVTVGKNGTITFLIMCVPFRPPCTWTITSGTKAYKGLHGKGSQVVDKYYANPAIFVLKGTVSQ